jgi:hypothetical protein
MENIGEVGEEPSLTVTKRRDPHVARKATGVVLVLIKSLTDVIEITLDVCSGRTCMLSSSGSRSETSVKPVFRWSHLLSLIGTIIDWRPTPLKQPSALDVTEGLSVLAKI